MCSKVMYLSPGCSLSCLSCSWLVMPPPGSVKIERKLEEEGDGMGEDIGHRVRGEPGCNRTASLRMPSRGVWC